MGKTGRNKKRYNLAIRLLAFVLFVLTLTMLYTGVVMVFSTFIINIFIATGLFSLVTFVELVDRINRFGKYGEKDARCQKDHSQTYNPCDGDAESGCCPDDKKPSGDYPYMNEYPNVDFKDYQSKTGTESVTKKTGVPSEIKRPDDSEYTKYED